MSLLSVLKSYIYPNPNPPDTLAKSTQDTPCRFPLSPSFSHTLTLPSGRILSYAQYGSHTGHAVLYNHGFPGSRLEAARHHDICTKLGLRLIAVDRPGHGRSSPHPGWTLLDFVKDLENLTDELGLEEYAVMGVSGGGPSTLACAHSLPSQKLKHISLICAVGPPNIGWRGADLQHRLGWPHGIPRTPYWLGRMFWRSQAIGRLDLSEDERIEMLLKEVKDAPESDRDIYADRDVLCLIVRSCAEAFRQGYDYVWDDGVVSCGEWGFRVEDVRRDLEAHLWYGKRDYSVPANHGVQIKARLGEKAVLRVEDETHAGILMHWEEEIFGAIAESMGRGGTE